MLRRRLSAGLCAVVLMAALVACPLRARAMASATLAAVGGATVIAATLAACGIYPYASAGEGSFGEWGARALTDLLEKYNEAHIESAIRLEQVRAYVVGRTLAVGREVWDKLRDFAAWLWDTYALTDNQTEVGLGEYVGGYPSLPVSSIDDFSSNAVQILDGSNWNNNVDVFVAASTSCVSSVYVFAQYSSGSTDYYNLQFISLSPFDVYVSKSYSTSTPAVKSTHYLYPEPYDGVQYYIGTYGGGRASTLLNGVQHIDYFEDAVRAIFGTKPILEGVTADTTTISVPAALPAEDDSEFVGLSVYPGTVSGVDTPATAITPQVVEEIIQQGVMSRERPVVRPVEIEVEAGTTVDTETGEVATESAEPIVISPTTIPLQASDYAIPSLSSVFPFSVPWDIMRIWQALDAEPRFPLQDFSLALDVPLLFGESPPVVRFDLASYPEAVSAKMDEVAGVVRYSLLLVACVGFLIFISQFIKW